MTWLRTVSTEIEDASASRDYKGGYHSEGDNARREACPCAVFGAQSLQSAGTRHTGVGMGHQDYVLTSVKLGKNGVEQIIEISLTNDERTALQKSAAAVQELVDILNI